MAFEVERQQFGVIRVSGEITIYSAAPFSTALFAALHAGTETCLVNVSDVSEVDTTGVQILLMAKRACEARKVRFALLDPSAVMQESLDLLRLADAMIDRGENEVAR
jgi:anti-anti-sigma factor